MNTNSYFIQCKLKTLLSNAVKDSDTNSSFKSEGYSFKHSEFNYRDGWVDDYWIVEKTIDASKYQDALVSFYNKLDKIADKIEFVGQAYVGYPTLSPTLVTRANFRDDFAFFRYAAERKGGGLMFMDKEKQAVDILNLDESIPDNFYTYWSAATKTKDYSAKLLVLFAAIEALVRKDGVLDFELRKAVLGDELDSELFAQKTGLRHRLSHGEHLSHESGGTKDYTDAVHKKLMSYFNTEVLKKDLLSINVVAPQRTEYENFTAGNTFVKTRDGTAIESVQAVLNAMEGDRFENSTSY
jgi:hypothetical protein